MQYHVLTTERCNLKCKYCGGTRDMPGIPLDITYEIEDLIDFIKKDPDPVIGFYGGEPLLAMDRFEEIIDKVPAKAFTLQTNGTLLHEVKPEYLQKLHSILVSLDGNKTRTDHNRGEGIYDLIMENISIIKKRGFEGDLIARMAYSDNGNIYEDVTHLLTKFDHVHWQLDVFWSDLDSRPNIHKWIDDYDRGIECLVNDFGNSMKEGEVLGIVPFIPVFNTLLQDRPHHIWCGSGMDSFTIMTSGNIEACPIAPELIYSNIGDIRTSTPKQIENCRPVSKPCTDCDIFWVCGGRCLYANQTMAWGKEWFDRVCISTRRMIEGLDNLVPKARELIKNNTLKPNSFDYPEVNNGCEIIP
jgi:putative peptide-modifying radical SAM enzyme